MKTTGAHKDRLVHMFNVRLVNTHCLTCRENCGHKDMLVDMLTNYMMSVQTTW